MQKTNIIKGIRTWAELPFEVYLSFEPIYTYYQELATQTNHPLHDYAQFILDDLKPYAELRGRIEDLSILHTRKNEIKKLLSILFPEPLQSNEIKTATIPFTDLVFNSTTRFEKILSEGGLGYKLNLREIDDDLVYIYACMYILAFKYGVKFNDPKDYYLDIPNAKEGTEMHYRALMNGDFAQIEPLDPKFALSEEDIQILHEEAHNVETWKRIIPPQSFVFEGFGIINFFNATVEQIISRLKSDLLKPEALYDNEHVENILSKFKRIFDMPQMDVGFVFLNKETKMVECPSYARFPGFYLDIGESQPLEKCFKDAVNEELLKDNIQIFSDISKAYNKSDLKIEKLKEKGYSSYAMIPIPIDINNSGLLEFGSPIKGEINSASIARIQELIPIFTVTLQRWVADHETLMEAIIQEHFTSIHPTVSWKFLELAEQIWHARQEKRHYLLDDVMFNNVYPLYGQSDIKGSSEARNQSVQADLMEQLDKAITVFNEAEKVEPLVFYQQLIHRMNELRAKLEDGMDAGDEIGISEFFKEEIYPAFAHIRSLSPAMHSLVDAFMTELDPSVGFIYKKRKAFDESVSLINDYLTSYLEKQQEEAQKIFPHYFEKYKTDGVEHNIYLGQSLVKDQQFNQIYLQNLQIWQLETVIGMDQLVYDLQAQLALPLTVASLILVHGSNIDIKFKMSSKKFDVDGGYNIRYEIVKKRIDKAYLKGTTERLTQPGKIAIVYSQDRDADRYHTYLDYLASQNKIHPDIEDVELEDLQGISGLRALRANIIYDNSILPKEEEE